MSDERFDEGEDGLCEAHVQLGEHEITSDADLPAATGGVERSAD